MLTNFSCFDADIVRVIGRCEDAVKENSNLGELLSSHTYNIELSIYVYKSLKLCEQRPQNQTQTVTFGSVT